MQKSLRFPAVPSIASAKRLCYLPEAKRSTAASPFNSRFRPKKTKTMNNSVKDSRGVVEEEKSFLVLAGQLRQKSIAACFAALLLRP